MLWAYLTRSNALAEMERKPQKADGSQHGRCFRWLRVPGTRETWCISPEDGSEARSAARNGIP